MPDLTARDRIVLALAGGPAKAGAIAASAGISESTVRLRLPQMSTIVGRARLVGDWQLLHAGRDHAERLTIAMRELEPMPLARAAASLLTIARDTMTPRAEARLRAEEINAAVLRAIDDGLTVDEVVARLAAPAPTSPPG